MQGEEGRLQIPPLVHPLKLEQANEIPILLHGYKVFGADLSWSYYAYGYSIPSEGFGSKDITVQFHDDGSAYVNFIPERLGKVQLSISACFEDGGMDDAEIDAEVVYPDRKPEKLYIISRQSDDDRPFGTIDLDLSKAFRTERIFPKARYYGASHLVPIPVKDVSFKLITAPDSDPPISLDEKTGQITALHVGHALIQTTFQDLTVLTCVAVWENANFTGEGTVCAELVPEGMTPPSSGFENLPQWSDKPPRRPQQ